jgi:hypothetical protein
MKTMLRPLSLSALVLVPTLLLVTLVVATTATTGGADPRAGAEGLSTCGTAAAPCVLAPVAVELAVAPAPALPLLAAEQARRQGRVRL